MKKLLSIIVFVLAASLSFSQTEITTTLSAEHLPVNGTKVSIIPPPDFISAVNFSGFQQTESGSSIMILDIPGPFSVTSRGFTKERLKTEKMELLETEQLSLNGYPALLIKAEQNAYGNTYTKHILAFGSERETILINGTYPKNLEGMGKAMENSLLSTFYDTSKEINPFDAVDFEISTEKTALVFAKTISNSLLFNRDGQIPSASEDQANFIVGKAFSNLDIPDKKVFSENRIKKLPVEIEKIISTEPIKIDGLKGYEIIASGINSKTKVASRVYQTILFTDSLYYILLGTAESNFENCMSEFKIITRSFRLK